MARLVKKEELNKFLKEHKGSVATVSSIKRYFNISLKQAKRIVDVLVKQDLLIYNENYELVVVEANTGLSLFDNLIKAYKELGLSMIIEDNSKFTKDDLKRVYSLSDKEVDELLSLASDRGLLDKRFKNGYKLKSSKSLKDLFEGIKFKNNVLDLYKVAKDQFKELVGPKAIEIVNNWVSGSFQFKDKDGKSLDNRVLNQRMKKYLSDTGSFRGYIEELFVDTLLIIGLYKVLK